jgi:glycosyltransferase 2 family protein
VKNWLLLLLKIGLPLAIIGWLLTRIDAEQWQVLRHRTPQWPLLAAAFAAALLAVNLGFVRWFLLVRAVALPFRLRDAVRLGFLGYLFNFVSIGSVGGDLFKAVFLAREQPGRRTLAVTSVVMDRLLGLFALLILASTAMLLADLPADVAELQWMRWATFSAAALAGCTVAWVLTPGFTTGCMAEMLIEIPRAGPLCERLIAAVRSYRRRQWLLAGLVWLSLVIHTLNAGAVYLMARSLFSAPPTAGEHLVMVPVASVAAALPFTPAGLGTFELAVDWLYRHVAPHTSVPGVTVALTYRLATIGVATVGIFVYWSSRREFRQAVNQADTSALANGGAQREQ